MLIFLYISPIILLLLIFLFRDNLFESKKLSYILFSVLFCSVFISFCFGVYEICQYASNIRMNGKIKIFLESFLKNKEYWLSADSLFYTDSGGSVLNENIQWYLLLIVFTTLFIGVIILSYFMFSKKVLKIAVAVLSIVCMAFTFPLFEKGIDICNHRHLEIEINKIKGVIENHEKRGICLPALQNLLKSSIGKFEKPYSKNETAVSRLKSLYAEMEDLSDTTKNTHNQDNS